MKNILVQKEHNQVIKEGDLGKVIRENNLDAMIKEDNLIKKNKKHSREIIDFVKNQSKEDTKNKFIKKYLSKYQSAVKTLSDEVFQSIHLVVENDDLYKIIQVFRYKEDLILKDVVNMIKDVNISYEDIIILEKMAKLNICTYDLKDMEDSDCKKIHNQLVLNKMTINLIKFIKYELYRKELDYFDNNLNPKFKVLPKLRSLYTAGDSIQTIINKTVIEEFSEFIINNLNDNLGHMEEAIDPITDDDFLINNEYEKLLLKEKFYENIKPKSYLERLRHNLDSLYLTIEVEDFFKRKVLLPSSGVIILVKDEESLVESILIKEIENKFSNNLFIVIRYKNKKEVVNSVILKKSFKEIFKFSNLEKNNMFLSLFYIYDFFEIEKYESELHYEVISPRYWKYRDKNYMSLNDTRLKNGTIKREYEVHISSFIRKINGKCSNEVLELADKLGIDLEDGQTIVKAHSRTYNKIK
ncbi:MAG: hypothetical protein R3Y64_10135 [Peptostreptococcaceae bacterium]